MSSSWLWCLVVFLHDLHDMCAGPGWIAVHTFGAEVSPCAFFKSPMIGD